MTPVFLTVDTELMWRHHAAGLEPSEVVRRSLDPGDVGIAWQLQRLAAHNLKACFFVDPMPALVYGLDPIKRVVGAILDAGQEVQLHLHPNWTGAALGDRGESHARFELNLYDAAAQRALISGAAELLVAAGARDPIAFRAGSYAANDDTIDALAALGFAYDSSHNGADHPHLSAIGLDAGQIAPIAYRGVTEVPVTVIEDRVGKLRQFQICALSTSEMEAALVHAIVENHGVVTIVSHSFELANRLGTRANAVHVRRFEALCALLQAARGVLPTYHFADRPRLALDRSDVPLGPNLLRTSLRRAEQLWSNWVAERAA
jgi:hypothetical protein